MCGIAGFAGLDDRALLEAMTGALRHRGPDGAGYCGGQGVGLGSQRLAIIDLDAGAEPLSDERGEVTVVFNGEIYNFKELRRELEAKGHRFKTRTDTEVIVHLYEEDGRRALEKLSGMFALAVWDPRKKTLLLARDPLGVKPLYYAVCGSRLYFGSEVKALLKAPDVSREVDLAGLTQYLDFLYVAAPRTIYKGIRKLRPGEWLSWREGSVETGTFWRPRIGGADLDRPAAMAELDGLLSRVISEQMAADVPVGLFLSGGIDSSTLASYLSRDGTRPEAFCAYFSTGGEDYNEIDKARVVARHFGLRLTELCIEPDIEEILDTLIDAFDEPLADSSALPTYWLSRLARQRVTVALTGIGGDEVFGGYPRYLGAKLLPAYQRLPRAARGALGAAAAWAPAQISSRNVGGWVRRFLAANPGGLESVYSSWLGHLSADDKRRVFTRALRAALPAPSQVRGCFDSFTGDFRKRVQAVDLQTYLPDDLLAHADRMSMKVGLELRVPLCDQRLVEFALSLPPESQVEGLRLKPMLKELLRDRVPLEIVSQRKQGFMIPLGPWFQDELKPLVERGMAGLKRRGLLRADGMEKLYREHMSGWRNRTDVLWSWILLERWLERYAPDLRGDSLPGKGPGGKKVLMVSDEIFPDSGGGGLGRGAWQESLHLVARGHEVRLWCLDRQGGRPAEETIDGMRVYRLDSNLFYRHPSTWPLLLSRSRQSLAKVMEGFNPEIVIAQSPLSAWLVQDRPELKDARFIYRYNSSWPEEYAIDRPGLRSLPGRMGRRWIEGSVIGRYDRVAAISEYMSRNFAGHYRKAATTLSAGINFADFTPGDRAAARRALGLSGSPLLVTVRNLRPRMGWEILLGAAELLLKAHPGLKVVIVGRGPLEPALGKEIVRRGLTDCVRLAGRVADAELPLYYRAADLFVLPTSQLEGLGLVLLEALACGTPCVGTPVGGIPEVLGPIDPGWVADAATPDAFAAAVRRGLASKIPAAALRENVRSRYGWNKMAEGLEALFAERPRLLHLVTRLDFGGSAENVALSALGAQSHGFDAAVAAGPSVGPGPDAGGGPVLRVPSLARELSPWRDLKAFIEIVRLLRDWKPDILHTHSSKAGVLGRWAAWLLRRLGAGPKAVVHTPHGHVFYGYFGPLKTRLFTALERWSAPAADHLVALSEGEKREHLALGIGRPDQWSVVPSGVSLDGSGQARDLGLPEGAVVVGCVARLDPVKGVDVLLEAAALVLGRTKRLARFLIVGDGSQSSALKEQARRLGIESRVVFAGYQADPIPFMKAMHIYAQPSRNEGMGKSLVLAQALGLPAAASKVCGIPDVVRDGETGLLVPPGDPRALADALERLIDDDALRARLGEAGRRRVLARDETGERSFSVESMVARLDKLYRAALATLALALLAPAAPARAMTLRAVVHAHSSISHNGTESLSEIARRARERRIDVLIPTDTFVARWEYGLWPLRGIIKKTVVQDCVLSFGIAAYLARIKAVREQFPGLVVIPGVEAAAYYRWEGLPWRHLTINDWSRHMLVIGLENADDYARLPVLGNSSAGRFEPFLLWPAAPLLLGFVAWRSTRRRRYAALALASLLFLANGLPFRSPPASPYAAQTPWTPYQQLIDYSHAAGGLAFWAHPDAPNWTGGTASPRVSIRTDPYPEALLRTSGFDGFALMKEGFREAGRPGGTWDQALALYLKGERPSPSWAIAELDYRDPAQTPIDSAQMILDSASREPRDILDALGKGRFYSLAVADRPLVLRLYRLSGASGSAGSGETLWGSSQTKLELELAFEDGGTGEAELEIVQDGKVAVAEAIQIPGRWSYEFGAEPPRHYYRVIVRGPGNNRLVTNPIFSFRGKS